MRYVGGGLGKSGQGIGIPIELEMRPFRARVAYGKISLPDGGHSTIGLMGQYSVPTTIVFIVQGL